MNGLSSIRGLKGRKLIPVTVAAVVLLVILAVALSSYDQGGQSIAFSAYWPPPSTYVPGSTPPTAYLEINYTGPGVGNFTYFISYNSSEGTVMSGHGSALVSGLAPFRVFAFIPVPANTVVVARAAVYRGLALPQNLLYNRSIAL